METAFSTPLSRSDRVLVLANGVFGNRMIDVATRLGADVDVLNFPWGQPVSIDQAADKLKQNQYKIVAMVHAETSTGVLNPAIGDLLKSTDSLYLLDCVTVYAVCPSKSTTGMLSVCYSGSQKCLSARRALHRSPFPIVPWKNYQSASKVPNWYLDMNLLTAYWASASRFIIIPRPSICSTAFTSRFITYWKKVLNRFSPASKAHARLMQSLEMGWEMLVAEPYRLPMLNTVKVPQGIDEKALRARLRDQYLIEVGSGLGDLAGKVIRIGLMGYGAKEENVDRLLKAIQEILNSLHPRHKQTSQGLSTISKPISMHP